MASKKNHVVLDQDQHVYLKKMKPNLRGNSRMPGYC